MNWEIIKTLEENSSRLVKEQIINEQANANNIEFFDGVNLALDPLITFGLKKIPESNSIVCGEGLSWEQFILIAADLKSRTLTGNAARNAVDVLISKATENEWNYWYRRILIKDLRCGVSDKTINKVKQKEFHVPIFSCQLAEDSANHEKKVKGKKILQIKLDGIRVLAVVQNDSVTLFSRNGKELTNFPTIEAEILNVFKGHSLVLDGEIMSASFQDLMKHVFRKTNANTADSVYYVFDYIPVESFRKGKWEKPQLERLTDLDDILENSTNVVCLPYEFTDLDDPYGSEKFLAFNKTAIDNGYEGIMIKDPDAPYECKRTRSWLKMKPFIEVSLECTGFEEGTGKNEGRLGALICAGVDDGKTICVNVGSGFTDEQRDEFWTNKDKLLNMVVEIRADAITLNQNGTYSLRFPRFKTFRGLTPHEKL